MAQVMERPRAEVPGVERMSNGRAALQRRGVLVMTVLPFAAFIYAIAINWGQSLTLTAAGIAFFFYVFTGLGITIGFHRYFTHGSFETSRFLRGLMAIAGSMAVQGSVLDWVADHRRHHAFSDKEGDPHSPHLEDGPGLKGLAKGLWHAHMGWLFIGEQSSHKRWAPDLVKDPMIVRIHRLFPLWVVLTFALPPLVGFVVTGTIGGAIAAALWGSLIRVFFLHHVTWSINSVCHFYGKRPFKGDDYSTNNWLLAIVSFGESWHNNHHAFPSAAVHGVDRGQVDISGGVISLMEKLRLARNVRRVQEKQIVAKRA